MFKTKVEGGEGAGIILSIRVGLRLDLLYCRPIKFVNHDHLAFLCKSIFNPVDLVPSKFR